jgi:uncharacterized protein YecT (DUF1311 family)
MSEDRGGCREGRAGGIERRCSHGREDRCESLDGRGREGAANPGKPDAASCIGVVSTPCLAVPSNVSTMAMADCLRRETAIWDERLNAAYKSWTSKCDSPDICEARRKLERAWIAYRDARCTLPHVEAQGGTIAIIEDADCLLDATAHQAIRIEQHITSDAN